KPRAPNHILKLFGFSLYPFVSQTHFKYSLLNVCIRIRVELFILLNGAVALVCQESIFVFVLVPLLERTTYFRNTMNFGALPQAVGLFVASLLV
ncbi:hypothetical protein, partial [Vibrio sp. L85]|uniref:hypothetical protein n=1 Tax=Vibrio sp. L85 TaxID=1769292 RepID=UPI001CBA9084